MDKEKQFKENLGQPKIKIPKIGSKIYVPTSLYLSHGADDFSGGIATVTEIITSNFLPEDHYNYYMVGIKERPDTSYNLRYLLENQAKWKKEYGRAKAHPDPDYSPESNRWD